MPKINVAFQLEGREPGRRIVDNSKTTLKKKLRDHPETAWRICFYDLQGGVKQLCQAIEDILQLPADTTEDVRVNSSGQVRSR